jgi:monoamine oxidase
MSYDIIIIGAGIAGLRTGIQILTTHPHMKCIILEKYNYKGGRVITYHEPVPGIGKVQLESGAGRIAHTHKKVLGLLTRYHLHTYPISGDAMFIGDSGIQLNRFSDLHDVFIEPLRHLPANILQTHTLAQVSEMVLGAKQTRELYSQFPYFSEIHTLRADHAIYVFDYEMGSMSGFVGCVEGMSTMIDGMVDDFQKLGGSIFLKQEVTAVSSLQDGTVKVVCKKDSFTAPLCVMALPSEAMKSIRGVSHLPVLD